MTTIDSIIIEAADPAPAKDFYRTAFGLADQLQVRAAEAPTSGFRGFTLSLKVSQPADVNILVDTAVDAGATTIKPVARRNVFRVERVIGPHSPRRTDCHPEQCQTKLIRADNSLSVSAKC